MKIKSKKFLFVSLLVVAVAVAAAFVLAGEEENVTSVQADLVTQDDISEIVTASGRIQPQTAVDITAEVSAEIVSVYVRDGDKVSKGDPLLLLDTIQTNSDVDQARFSLDEIMAMGEAAESQHRKDSLEYARQTRLFDQGLTSETDLIDARYAFENSRASFKATRAQIRTQRARLDKAEDNQSKTRILSPMSGVITYLNAEVGEIAQAQTSFTQGRTLMTISDLSVFEVEIDVDETEISKIQLGHPASIRVDAFRDTAFDGTVVEIGNSAIVQGEGTENFSTTFKVKVRFDDQNAGIRPGMSATVDITTAISKDAVLIPYASVVVREFDPDSIATRNVQQADDESDGMLVSSVSAAQSKDGSRVESGKGKSKKVKKSGVFLFKGGKAEFVEVSTGIADDRNIAAISGPQPGDTVISGTFQTLRELEHGETVSIDESSLERIENE